MGLGLDMTILQKTGGKRSLDDFVRRFHGGQSGPAAVKPYTFEDVLGALNEVAPRAAQKRTWSRALAAPVSRPI